MDWLKRRRETDGFVTAGRVLTVVVLILFVPLFFAAMAYERLVWILFAFHAVVPLVAAILLLAGTVRTLRREDTRLRVSAVVGLLVCGSLLFVASVIGMLPAGFKAAEYVKSRKSDFARILPTPVPKGPLHSSTLYGYQVGLAPPRWHAWTTELSQYHPDADFGMYTRDDTYIVVNAYSLEAMPDIGDDAVFSAMLAPYDIDFHDSRTKPAPVPVKDGKGWTILTKIDAGSDSPYTRHDRVMRRRNVALHVFGWGPTGSRATALLPGELALVAPLDGIPPKLPVSLFPPRDRERHASLFTEVGNYLYEAGQMEGAVDAWKVALAHGGKDPEPLSSAITVLSDKDRDEEALALLDEHASRFPDAADLEGDRAWLLDRVGRTEESHAVYAKYFADLPLDDEDLTYYAWSLVNAEKIDEAVALLERYQARHDSAEVRNAHARILARAGKADAAVALLAADEGAPFDPRKAIERARLATSIDRAAEAAKIYGDMIERGFASSDVWSEKGAAEYELGWYREAKTSYEKALALSPADEDIKESLAYVSAALGEGENTLLKTPIDPVPLPAASEDEARGDEAGASCVYLLHATAMRFRPGERFLETTYRTARILDHRGVDRFSTLRFSFDPLHEDVYVNRVEVFDAGGALVSAGDVKDYYVLDDPEEGMATTDRTLHVPVAGLQPGYRIESVVTKRAKRADDAMPFREFWFVWDVPVRRALVWLDAGDGAGTQSWTSSGVEAFESDGGRCWRPSPPVIHRSEPFEIPWSLSAGHVVLHGASSLADEIDEYRGEIDDVLAADPEVCALAARLVEGKQTDEEKIAAIHRHVNDNCTYKAIVFGRRARIMQPPRQVLANRYGDCKDQSALLAALLDCAGIPAHLALVTSSGRAYREVASLDQFDHMIVYLPGQGRFIDPTDLHSPSHRPVPAGLAEGEALVLDWDAPRFETIPAYPAGSTRVSSSRVVTPSADGSAAVAETIRYEGYYASFLRNDLRLANETGQRRIVQSMIEDAGLRVDVRDIRFAGLDDPEAPLQIEVAYSAADLLHAAGDAVVGRVAFGLDAYYARIPPIASRRSEFFVHYPFEYATDTIFLPLDGRACSADGGAPLEGSRPESEWSGSIATEDGPALRIATKLEWRRGRYVPDGYAPFAAEMESYLRAASPTVRYPRP